MENNNPDNVIEKSIVFDTGAVISLTLNNLLWILEPLKKQFNGKFYISESVEYELIKKPLRIKRFEFEALQVLRLVKGDDLEIIHDDSVKAEALKLLDLANNCFMCQGKPLCIVHLGEMSSLAVCIKKGSSALVVDERTTRMLMENPLDIAAIMQKKLHAKVDVNKVNLEKFQEAVKNIKILRSVELATIAYRLKLLDSYLPDKKDADRPGKTLLDSILWGIKLNGCSVSENEIDEIVRREG